MFHHRCFWASSEPSVRKWGRARQSGGEAHLLWKVSEPGPRPVTWSSSPPLATAGGWPSWSAASFSFAHSPGFLFRLFETERHTGSQDRALHRLQAAFRAGIFNSVEVACSREGLRVVFAIQGEMSDAAEEAKRNEKARSLGHQLEIGPTGEVPPSSTNGAKKTP